MPRWGSVNYYLDGGPNISSLRNTGNAVPNPDALQEFRVDTTNYSAEFGRFGNGVINVVTRSGTNEFHGSAFEFFRNTHLNANSWNALTKTPLHRNQFGGTFGGPIIHNKTFFFGSYSGLRQSTTTFLNSAVVPSATQQAGNFSALPDLLSIPQVAKLSPAMLSRPHASIPRLSIYSTGIFHCPIGLTVSTRVRCLRSPALPQISVSGYFTLGQGIAGPVASDNNLQSARRSELYHRPSLLAIRRGGQSG